jgi:Protein of unknown function (DUF3467)
MAEIKQQTSSTRSTNFQEYYANNCNLRMTNWDVLFEFGKITGISEHGVAVVSDIGVYVSPQQAKAMLGALIDQVNKFEHAFGEIIIQPKQR